MPKTEKPEKKARIHPEILVSTIEWLRDAGKTRFAATIQHTTLAAVILDGVAVGKIKLPDDLLSK